MYVLTLFYRHGSQVRMTNEDPLVLEESGEEPINLDDIPF
jgi:hypothetical protein